MHSFSRTAAASFALFLGGIFAQGASDLALQLHIPSFAAFAGDACPAAAAQSVVAIPNLRFSNISADGHSVGGYLLGSAPSLEAVFWTPATGLIHTGRAVVSPSGLPAPLSGSGQYLGGELQGGGHAFRTSVSGLTDTIPFQHPFASESGVAAMSNDGNVVVGTESSQDGLSLGSWRWTPQSGIQTVPYFSISAISGDGQSIIGYPTDSVAQIGVLHNGSTTLLPYVGGGTGGFLQAAAINFDGTIVVGASGNSPAIWFDAAGALLPLPAGATSGIANDLSADGSVVLGTTTEAFIWTQPTGSILLSAYFASHGIDLSGYTLHTATISDDGLVFAVNAQSLTTNRYTTLVVTIPAPATPCIGLASLVLVSRRRRPTRSLPTPQPRIID